MENNMRKGTGVETWSRWEGRTDGAGHSLVRSISIR